jgi:hypothetical protein
MTQLTNVHLLSQGISAIAETLCRVNKRIIYLFRRSRWPRGLRRGSTAARLPGLRVRIPLGAWMSISCECNWLSGRGLCDGLIPDPEQSYRVWCVCLIECDEVQQ